MRNRIFRFFAISNHVPLRPQKITAKELQEKLASNGMNISLRTVQRDLDVMHSMQLFNLVLDSRNKPHGWYLEKKLFDNRVGS